MADDSAAPGLPIAPVLTGLVLLATCAALAILSPRFTYGSPELSRPIVAIVVLLVVAGLAYLLGMGMLFKRPLPGIGFAAAIALGLIMRVVLFFSTPIQEDDFYRYLWDGAVVAHAYSPYRFAPSEVQAGSPAVPEPLPALAVESGVVIERVNFPELTTLYPPVSQGAFALAYLIAPWKLNAWRTVILMFDLGTLCALVALLRSADLPSSRALIYWWNPVLLMEAYNSAHMDVIALPFAVAAVWFAGRHAPVRAMSLLALSAAAKLWPLLLGPLVVRATRSSRARLAAAVVIGLLLLALLLAPMAQHLQQDEAGLTAYGSRWEMNDALFTVLTGAAGRAADWLDRSDAWAGRVARVGAAVALLGCLLALLRKPVTGPIDLCNRAAILLGALFMLSPTQFPWYYLWLLPFLAVRPRASLLLLTATLPLYYLKFFYAARGEVDFFHNRLVWLEHGPILALALYEAFAAWRRTETRVPRDA